MPDCICTESPETMASYARELYAGAASAAKWKQSLRPYICPFHTLVGMIPSSATVLDVGCGEGLFLLLLARLGRLESGLGFDANKEAIEAGRRVASRHGFSGLRFQYRDVLDGFPEGQFDVVSIIDVMHHVPAHGQRELVERAVEHVKPGGCLLYKDMVSRPFWRASANRLHDLVLARQWISYVGMDDVTTWAQSCGAAVEAKGSVNMLWYGHEWCVLRR